MVYAVNTQVWFRPLLKPLAGRAGYVSTEHVSLPAGYLDYDVVNVVLLATLDPLRSRLDRDDRPVTQIIPCYDVVNL